MTKQVKKFTAICNRCGMKFMDTPETIKRILAIQHSPDILKHSCGGDIIIIEIKESDDQAN